VLSALEEEYKYKISLNNFKFDKEDERNLIDKPSD